MVCPLGLYSKRSIFESKINYRISWNMIYFKVRTMRIPVKLLEPNEPIRIFTWKRRICCQSTLIHNTGRETKFSHCKKMVAMKAMRMLHTVRCLTVELTTAITMYRLTKQPSEKGSGFFINHNIPLLQNIQRS